jgi:hypothetical protein
MIGRHARHLAAQSAYGVVAGCLCFADHSVRDYQLHTNQVTPARISTVVALPDPGLRSFQIRRRSLPRESSRA